MRNVSLSLMTLILLAAALRADFPDPAKLPANPNLPDPLVMLDGTKVTTAKDWESKRRPELKQLFQHFMYGTLPPPAKVEAKVLHEDKNAYGGKATLCELAVTVGAGKAPPIHVLLVVPNARKGPAPVFVGMNFEGNQALVDDPKVAITKAWMYPNRKLERGNAKDTWAIDQAIERGYAVATFYSGDVDPDRKDARGGLRPYFDPDEKAGTIAFWAWGIHRVVDHLVTRDDVDAKRVIVVGHSRLGKTALVAAAFDERIALAIPHQAGCGGTAPSRGKVGESVTRINTSFPHWFNATFKKFNDRPEHLPFDQNGLAALVAPRPLLFTNAVEDTWANPDGQFEVLKAAEPVWKLLGAGGLDSRDRPPAGTLSSGTLGYYIRAGKHSMTREDWKVYLDYADKHLGKSAARGAARKRVLLIGSGPDGHPPQTHEYEAGLKVVAACLAKVPEVEVMAVKAEGKWANGPELIDRADGVVLFLTEGANWVSQEPSRLAAFERLAKRGGGRVTLHWAMGTREAKPIAAFVDLFGGCHGGPDRAYKVVTTPLKVAKPGHAVTRGVKDVSVKEEFYYRLKFAKEAVTPLVQVAIDDEVHTVGWAYEPPGRGRAFGFSGLHFHENWRHEGYRRLVAQGVLWSVGVPVPVEGLVVPVAPE